MNLPINKFMRLVELFETKLIKINEGGWDSTITQSTKINPDVVSAALNVMKKFTVDFNNWLKIHKQPAVSIGHPLGSTAWHTTDSDDKEYGDIDLQMICVKPNDKLTISQMSTHMNILVSKFINESKPPYIYDNGKTTSGHIIVRIRENAYVQVDLIWTDAGLANWQRYRMTPAQNIKGAAYGTLFATLGEIMNMSIQAAGVQMKIKDGVPVNFTRNHKVDSVDTLTTDIHNFALDILKKLHERIHPNVELKIDPELAAHPGIKEDSITAENLTAAIRGLAKSFAENNMYGYYNLKDIANYDDFIKKFKSYYTTKMSDAAASTKFNKAKSPEAITKAEETKKKLISHGEKVISLL